MTTAEKLIKNKLGLLELANYLKNVSEACRVMGYSRDTFYRVRKAYEEGGIEALKEKGIRDKVKVIIGGAAVSEEFAQSVGADGYGADGFQAVRVVEALNASLES